MSACMADAPVKVPTRKLGSSGLEVPVIALGCFAFGGDHATGVHLSPEMAKLHAGVWGDQDDEDTYATVKAALDAGVNFFDNAEMYGDGYAEEVLGRALRKSGYARDQYIIATKVCETYLAPDQIEARIDASLKRMQLDYIDLYQLHWHSRAALRTEKYPERPLEAEIPLKDTLLKLAEMQKAGKIRHIGVCNFGVKDLTEALATGVPIVSNQICYNLLWRGIEPEVVPLCTKENIAILPWSPMGQALLADKFKAADDVPPGRARSRLFSSARPQQRHGEPGLEKETFMCIDKIRIVSKGLEQPMANVVCAVPRLRLFPLVRLLPPGLLLTPPHYPARVAPRHCRGAGTCLASPRS
eukprot:SAG22_NODE_202_length_15324_cov_7.802627_7_plen_356_part_00